MSSKFPLFHLPFVPLSTVLNTVELNILLKISLCSKKSSKLCKSIRNKSKKVDIVFSNAKSEVSIEREGIDLETMESWDESIYLFYAFDISELPEGEHEQLKIGDMKVPVTKGRGEDSLITYWEDPFIGMTKLLDLVTDFFDCQIHDLSLSAKNHPKDPRRTIDWIMGRQGSIARVIFMCKETTEEELKYFLDACKITDDLYLDVNTSEQFRHTINFEMENLEMKHAHWLTLDNLFSLNCRKMGISHSSLTSNDINLFLKHWLNGGNSRLGMLTLRTNEPTFIGAITAGLNAVLRTYNAGKAFKDTINENGIRFNQSYDIRRNDGVMGSIIHYTNSIEFLVWPDWENTPYS